MEYQGLQIEHLGHDTFKIKGSELVVYVDPYNLEPAGPAPVSGAWAGLEPADFVFISHNHFDHFSVKDIKKLLNLETIIIAPASCQKELAEFRDQTIKYLEADEEIDLNNLKVRAIPAYNLDKFRSAGVPYHPKESGFLGYIIEIDNQKIYHTGDSDNIPEMINLAGKVDVLLVPVSGTYVMTWQEAAECCKIIKPKLAIPMHYGDIVGSQSDAESFKQALSDSTTEVRII